MNWISVYDKSPGEDNAVLTVDVNGFMAVCFILEGKWRYTGCYFETGCNCNCIAPVTHWMKLPDLPEENEE